MMEFLGLGIATVAMMATTVFYMATLELRIRALGDMSVTNAKSTKTASQTSVSVMESVKDVAEAVSSIHERVKALESEK